MEGDAGTVPLSTDEDQQTADTSAEDIAADAATGEPPRPALAVVSRRVFVCCYCCSPSGWWRRG